MAGTDRTLYSQSMKSAIKAAALAAFGVLAVAAPAGAEVYCTSPGVPAGLAVVLATSPLPKALAATPVFGDAAPAAGPAAAAGALAAAPFLTRAGRALRSSMHAPPDSPRLTFP